jgi:two-component system, cell cycle response regulator DivK
LRAVIACVRGYRHFAARFTHRNFTVSTVILVANDTRDTREMYVEYLVFHGYTVFAAIDGEETLRLTREHRPAAIVLDLSTSHVHGWLLVKVLKEDDRMSAAKIVVLSGHVLGGARQSALAAGADAFLMKPCLLEELRGEIKRLLGSASTSVAVD